MVNFCFICEIYRRVKQRKLGEIFESVLFGHRHKGKAKDGSHRSVSEIV